MRLCPYPRPGPRGPSSADRCHYQGSEWSDRSGFKGRTGRPTIMDDGDQT